MALARAYIFRDREILVERGGDAAKAERIASFVSEDIRARFDDRVSGGTSLILQSGTPAPDGCSFEPMPGYFYTHDDAEIDSTLNAIAASIGSDNEAERMKEAKKLLFESPESYFPDLAGDGIPATRNSRIPSILESRQF